MNRNSEFGSQYDKGFPRSIGESQIEPDVKEFVDAEPRDPIRSQALRPQIFSADVEISFKWRDAPKSEWALGDDFAT